jgi:hypothetical protein
VKEVDEQAWQAMLHPQTDKLRLNIQCFYTAPSDYHDMTMTRRLLPNAKTAKEYIQQCGKYIVQ